MAEIKWIEIISLRFSRAEHSQTFLEVFNQVKREFEAAPNSLLYAELYVNKNVETDWSIHLHWSRRPEEQPARTVLGLSIAECLETLGLVNHSVWEQKGAVNETIKFLCGELRLLEKS
ncbi:MAG: hypothetical protein GQF41_4492 [Candidatus Rifleibacterium amylolyticum]|nr:MAG: hypothetical protein GQF41_4492 [Candidatus Rifleibacterium amylolyticum]